MRPSRRGFTLIEITVALVMFSIVATVLTRMLILSQRVTTAKSVRASLQSNLRVGSLVVPNELRMLNQSDSTDIADVSDSSITYRAMRGYYVLCAVTSATSIKVINVQPSPYSFDYRAPVSGDSVFIFFENDTLKMSDDKWAPAQLTGAAASTCTFGGVSRVAHTFTLGGAVAGINTTRFPLTGFVLGAPVRTYELTRISLFTSGGQKWMGMCTGSATCTLQPVLGPLATNGLTITRYNDVGTVVTGNTFANRNSLRSLKIRFIGIGEQIISRGGDSRSVIQDTLTTVVTLRNVKQN